MAFGDLLTSPPQSFVATAAIFAVDMNDVSQTAIAGNLLVACHHVEAATSLVPQDDGENIWTKAPIEAYDGVGGFYNIWYKIAAGDEELVTFRTSASAAMCGILYHIEGPFKTDPLDKMAMISEQTGTAFDSGETESLAGPDSIAIVLAGGEPIDQGDAIGSWVNSYIEDIDPTALPTGDTFMGSAHKVLTGQEPARGQATWDNAAVDGAGLIAVFIKEPSARKRVTRRLGVMYG